MNKLFNQIAKATEVDKEKDYATIKFPELDNSVYEFEVSRNNIYILHKSHAPIAAVTGKRIKYKSKDIEATNHAFKWLGIKCVVEYDIKKRESSIELDGGVISFF